MTNDGRMNGVDVVVSPGVGIGDERGEVRRRNRL